MIPSKLIKALEREGFSLDFPSYESREQMIIEIIKLSNPRLNLSIPLLLIKGINYNQIIKKIGTKKKEFDKIIAISKKIFSLEGLDNKNIKSIIKENNIKEKFRKEEFDYFYNNFKEFQKNKEINEERRSEEQTALRAKLTMNKSLSNIYSPGKIRILSKIYSHEPLSNTELKYYYRAIRPLSNAVLNKNMREFIEITERTKKYRIN